MYVCMIYIHTCIYAMVRNIYICQWPVKDMRDEKYREHKAIQEMMDLYGTRSERRKDRAAKEWEELRERVRHQAGPGEKGADFFLDSSSESGSLSLDSHSSFIDDDEIELEDGMVEYLRQGNRHEDISTFTFPKVLHITYVVL